MADAERTRTTGSRSQPTYNPQINRITWDLNELPSGLGWKQPKYDAYFQIAVIPSLNQVNQDIDLILDTIFKGTDSITKQETTNLVRKFTSVQTSDLGSNGVVTP